MPTRETREHNIRQEAEGRNTRQQPLVRRAHRRGREASAQPSTNEGNEVEAAAGNADVDSDGAPQADPPPNLGRGGGGAATRVTRLVNGDNVLEYNPVDDFINNGTYGSVFKGTFNGRTAACKLVQCAHQNQELVVTREIMLIGRAHRHQNIVGVLGEFTHSPTSRVIAFEHMDMDLYQYINFGQRGPIEFENVLPVEPFLLRSFMHQLLSAVAFLHELDIVHRDLKSTNILLDDNGTLQVCDLGMGRFVRANTRLTPRVVTLAYRAPEILFDSRYGLPSDVWSCLCIMNEMLLGYQPFCEAGRRELDLMRYHITFFGPGVRDHIQTFLPPMQVIERLSPLPPEAVKWCSRARTRVQAEMSHIMHAIQWNAVTLYRAMGSYSPRLRRSAQQCLQYVGLQAVPVVPNLLHRRQQQLAILRERRRLEGQAAAQPASRPPSHSPPHV